MSRPIHALSLPMRSLLLFVVAALASLTFAARARAELPRLEEESLMQEAETHMVEGHFAQALPVYARLFGETRKPVYQRNLGRCHQFLKHPDEAILNFRQYLREAADLTDAERTEVEGFIREMEELKRQREAKGATTPAPATDPSPVLQQTSAGDTGGRHGILRVSGTVLLAAGVLAMASGVYFSLHSRSLAEKGSQPGVFDPDDYAAGESAEKLQYVGYGVGAALLAGGATCLYLAARKDDEGLALVPRVGLAGAGLSLQGTF